MAGIPDKTIIFRKFDLWWPLLASIFTWAKKWPKWLRTGSLRAVDRRIVRPFSFPSFRVRGGGGHFGPPTMAKVAETATRARVIIWREQSPDPFRARPGPGRVVTLRSSSSHRNHYCILAWPWMGDGRSLRRGPRLQLHRCIPTYHGAAWPVVPNCALTDGAPKELPSCRIACFYFTLSYAPYYLLIYVRFCHANWPVMLTKIWEYTYLPSQ